MSKELRSVVLITCLVLTFMFSFIGLNLTGSPASAAEPIVLAMAPAGCSPPPAKGLTLVIANQMKLIEERSNGRLKIEIYWGESLAKGRDLVAATSTGICDVAKLDPHKEPGKLPLSGVGGLPGIGTHMWPRTAAYWDLMSQEPLVSEYRKYGIVPFTVTLVSEAGIVGNVPIRTVADIKGKKIAAAGLFGEIISLLGGVPIAMSPTEEYDGMKKGIVDGGACPPSAVNDFKFYEVTKYYTKFQLSFRVTPTVIREEAWKKIPSDVQKIILDSAPDLIKIAYRDFVEVGDGVALKVMSDNGIEIIEPAEAENAILREKISVLADNWAEGLEKKGMPAKKLLADYRTLVEKYEKINPYKK